MPVKIYFETMTSGMLAKLDPKYRIKHNLTQSLARVSANSSSSRYLSEKFGCVEVGRKK